MESNVFCIKVNFIWNFHIYSARTVMWKLRSVGRVERHVAEEWNATLKQTFNSW